MENTIVIFGQSFNIFGVIITLLLLVFIYMLASAHKKKKLDWTDMITRDGSTVSTTKILQLIGGVVATWIMIKTTVQGTLTWDLFAIYLSYVASIDGFSKLILAKYAGPQSNSNQFGSNGFGGMNNQNNSFTPYNPTANQQPVVNQQPAVQPAQPAVIPPTVKPAPVTEDDELTDHAMRGAAKAQ